MTYFTVSTSGTGLVVRQVSDTDTTVYADHQIATFDTLEEASTYAKAHDSEYWDE